MNSSFHPINSSYGREVNGDLLKAEAKIHPVNNYKVNDMKCFIIVKIILAAL